MCRDFVFRLLFAITAALAAPTLLAETDRGYITKNAVNAYGSTFDQAIIEQLIRYQVIMVGEVHGTVEYPQFALDLVKNLKRSGKEVTLALEIPANFQGAVQNAISHKSLPLLADTEFFKSNFQDGRESLAMGLVILSAAAEGAEVFCFDKSWTADALDRDLEMARNVTQYVKKNPSRTVVLLAGNYHTRLEEKVAEASFTPMGFYLSHMDKDPIEQTQIFSIMGRTHNGSNWACYGSNAEECGVKNFEGAASNYASANDWHRYLLVEPSLQDGHQGTLFVRTTSASPPLISELPYSANCQMSPQNLHLVLSQEFWTFDQSPFGHRYLFGPSAEKLCSLASSKLIDQYILMNKTLLIPYQSRILFFHSAQGYAIENKYRKAVSRFQRSFNPEEPNDTDFHWNAYVSATIAFLRKDINALRQARASFPASPQGGDAVNSKVIDRFIKCLDSPYQDAYDGTGSCAS